MIFSSQNIQNNQTGGESQWFVEYDFKNLTF
jgi:hypothetical protein